MEIPDIPKNSREQNTGRDFIDALYEKEISNSGAFLTLLQQLQQAARVMSDETVHNEALSCMHFAFPSISEQLEEHTLFLYGHKEPAYRLFAGMLYKHIPWQRRT